MSRWIRWLMALLPMMACVHASGVEFRSTAWVGEQQYRFDVLRDGDQAVRHLEVTCKPGCAGWSAYREDFIDRPLYLMQPKDGADRVVSVWLTGSAYRIVVYRLDEAGVHKVLDRGSRTPPAMSFDDRGREALRLCTPSCTVLRWSDDRHAYVGA